MDRKHQEKLPAIQLSFIQHLVSPLYQSCAEAGIIPGLMEGSTTPPSESPQPLGSGEEGFAKTEGQSLRVSYRILGIFQRKRLSLFCTYQRKFPQQMFGSVYSGQSVHEQAIGFLCEILFSSNSPSSPA